MLAHRLNGLCAAESVVLGAAHGGIPVAFEIARALLIPLDVIAVHRIIPAQRPQLTLGALAEGGTRTPPSVLLPGLTHCGAEETAAAVRNASTQVDRMVRLYRAQQPQLSLVGRTAVIVDDGVVTSSTAWASCALARARGANRVVFAAPMIPADAVSGLYEVADEIASVVTPPRVSTVSQWFARYPRVTDSEVLELLRAAGRLPTAHGSTGAGVARAS